MVDIPGNTSTTTTLTVGVSLRDTLEVAGDHDWLRIQLVAGQTYEFRLHGEGTSELVDPYLRLRDAGGVEIASNDDSASWDGANGLDSRLIFTATTSGTYYVDVGEFGDNAAGDYLITAVQHNPAGMVFTNDEIAWQLTNNFAEFFSDPPAAFNVGVDGQITVNVTALTAAGQTLALAALQAWEDLTGIDFVTTSGAAEITFDDSDAGATAYANTSISGNTITSATVMITEGWLGLFGSGFNSYSFETYIHEIGHALGLGHGGNYNGSATFGVDNFYLNDSLAYSIMSYMQVNGDEFSGPNTTIPADFRFMLTPAVADYIAITNLYGDNSATRTGNTTYGYNSNTGNTVLDQAVTIGSDVFFMVHDDGGTDTLDFSGYSGGQFISLFAEQPSNVLGGIWNLWISRGTTVENAIGGSGNDVLRGNNVSNTLNGGAGIDSMYGNLGNDTFIVTNGDNIFETAGQGTDTVRVSGSAYTLTAGASVEFMETTNQAGTGSVTMVGNELGQTMRGNNGSNTLVGGGGVDHYTGYLGDDIYVVDNAAETITEIAGQGTDAVYTTVSYTLAAGVSIERMVAAPLASTNAIDLTGNELGQVMVGNNGVNTNFGGAGNDSIYGMGGNDFIEGAQGNDNLFGGTGIDRFVFRESLGVASGIDRIYDLTAADYIRIDANAVGAVTALTANQFRLGTAALDADDRIIYDQATGIFRFDPDGNGAQAAIVFGVVDGAPVIDHTYFELA